MEEHVAAAGAGASVAGRRLMGGFHSMLARALWTLGVVTQLAAVRAVKGRRGSSRRTARLTTRNGVVVCSLDGGGRAGVT